MSGFMRELGQFMLQHKKLWLIPILVSFALIGTLVVVTEGSSVAPFVYTLF